MAAFTEKPTDLNSSHDDVIDDGGDVIDKSLVTDSKPETESDHKPNSAPEFDQRKNLVATSKKLNPEAKEFFPSYMKNNSNHSDDFMITKKPSGEEFNANKERKAINQRPRRRNYWRNGRASKDQRKDSVRRTVYITDIDQDVTEEFLAGLFSSYGHVVDCRICGNTDKVLRFAFVEFSDDQAARAALSLDRTMIGYYPVRVLPSRTAIHPVTPTYLPRSEDEREMCNRTIYCTNVDNIVTNYDIKTFFESACGEVTRLRLLGDWFHSTRTAFVEFAMPESAVAALNCSGMVLGSQRIRVSPSKTPVRPRKFRLTSPSPNLGETEPKRLSDEEE